MYRNAVYWESGRKTTNIHQCVIILIDVLEVWSMSRLCIQHQYRGWESGTSCYTTFWLRNVCQKVTSCPNVWCVWRKQNVTCLCISVEEMISRMSGHWLKTLVAIDLHRTKRWTTGYIQGFVGYRKKFHIKALKVLSHSEINLLTVMVITFEIIKNFFTCVFNLTHSYCLYTFSYVITVCCQN